jgi:LPS-assembly protein
MLRALSFIALLLTLALPAVAQEQATLVADSMQIQDDNTLIALGHVEIFYMGQKLVAKKVVFDQSGNRLIIEGPLVLSDGKGSLILASQADLSADMTTGVITSARLVLQQQLQLAAAEIQRVDPRYTVMQRVVASSCKVCAGSSTPLWEVRATRIVHDKQEQQLYFDHAQLRFGGIPIMYIPRLRMPDPTLKRANGFLIARLKTNTNFGTGISLPYFLELGASRDLTLTPFFTTDGSRTLNLRYRQAFAAGAVEFDGAVSTDNLRAGNTRGYVLATGDFNLPRDFKLRFSGEVVSDAGYLLEYGLNAPDRLDSRVEITRTRRNEYIAGRVIAFHSLRSGEDNAVLPRLVADLTWHRRFTLGNWGGAGGFQLQTHAHDRSSNNATSDSNGDGIMDGRDMQRLSLRADWRKNLQLSNGMEFAVLGEAAADFYQIGQDATYEGANTRLHGALAAELRWPLLKTQSNGVAHVLEPVMQVVIAANPASSIPNEDSALVEFDEGNLFALSRFPGSDAVENGFRANLGVNYLRQDPQGWTLGLTAGRVLRKEDLNQFSAGSGLSGISSDWMAAWQLDMAQFNVTNRMLFDDNLNMTKAEVQSTFTGKRLGLSTGYVHTVADAKENRTIPISEINMASSYKFTDTWSGSFNGRYDLESQRTAKAGVGVTFRNECLLVDLSLSRRFTSSSNVSATTDFGLSVELLGFGGSSASGPARQCRR